MKFCYIDESYFKEHPNFVKMLDADNPKKQAHRIHLRLLIEYNENKFYIPLRRNLKPAVRKYGRIGHEVPSKERPNAGLDFRYTLVINNDSYIVDFDQTNIPASQLHKIEIEYGTIQKEFETYIRSFIRYARKGRAKNISLYKESSLLNYIDLLIERSKK